MRVTNCKRCAETFELAQDQSTANTTMCPSCKEQAIADSDTVAVLVDGGGVERWPRERLYAAVPRLRNLHQRSREAEKKSRPRKAKRN